MSGQEIVQPLDIAVVNYDIRADTILPLQELKHFRVTQYYFNEGIGDIGAHERGAELVKCSSGWDLYRKLRGSKPDIIQAPEPFWFPETAIMCLVVFIFSWRYRIPYFVPFLENLDPYRKFAIRLLGINVSRPLVWIYLVWAKIYLNRALLIMAVNGGAKETVLRLGINPEKVFRFLWGVWGVDLTRFAPGDGKFEEGLILYAGRIDEQKGIDVLLKAFMKVKDEVPNARLRFVGKGKMLEWAKKFVINAEIQERVEFVDFVKNFQLPDLLRTAHVFVSLPRTTKGWAEQVGQTAEQALACGVPVVSTWSGGIPEYLAHGYGAFLVRENDIDATAAAIIYFLREPNIDEVRKHARTWAEIKLNQSRNLVLSEKLILDAFYRRYRSL